MQNAAVKITFLFYDFCHDYPFASLFTCPDSKSFLSTYFGLLILVLIEVLCAGNSNNPPELFLANQKKYKTFLGTKKSILV